MNLSGTVEHPDFGAVNYEAFPLSDDPDTQVVQTIGRMRQQVREDSSHPLIQAQAAQLLSGDPCSDAFWWVKGRVQFQRDEVTGLPVRRFLDGDVIEVLIRPRDLAQMPNPKEDCDGFASYTPALLRALGIPCSFVTVAADGRDPSQYSHVYAACYPNGQRVPLDVSHGAYPGWEVPNVYGKRKEWPIDGWDLGEWFLFGLVVGALYELARWTGVI